MESVAACVPGPCPQFRRHPADGLPWGAALYGPHRPASLSRCRAGPAAAGWGVGRGQRPGQGHSCSGQTTGGRGQRPGQGHTCSGQTTGGQDPVTALTADRLHGPRYGEEGHWAPRGPEDVVSCSLGRGLALPQAHLLCGVHLPQRCCWPGSFLPDPFLHTPGCAAPAGLCLYGQTSAGQTVSLSEDLPGCGRP